MINTLIANILPFMPRKFVWIFSQRYIAGETIEDGLRAARELNEKGVLVTVDLLGEYLKNIEEATQNKEQYLEIINRFTSSGIKGNFSLKPTMFGLLIDKEVSYQNIREVVALAVNRKSFIRIDMEDSQCVDLEIDLYLRLKQEFPAGVGLVLQSYLRRTPADLDYLIEHHTSEAPVNFRLCKGIYVEPKEIAWKGYSEVQKAFLDLLETMFRRNIYVGIATHDKFLIESAYELIERYSVPADQFEFQMLYGVTPELRSAVMAKGYTMRVYVPFGREWFGYSTRRLKENPKVASHIIKALFFRG